MGSGEVLDTLLCFMAEIHNDYKLTNFGEISISIILIFVNLVRQEKVGHSLSHLKCSTVFII